jgi:signal transduction histidine kinase
MSNTTPGTDTATGGEDQAQRNRKFQLARVQSIASSSGAIAHKLNNVLAGLMGYTSLLKKVIESGKKPEAIPRYMAALEESGERIHELARLLMTTAQKSPAFAPDGIEVVEIVAGAIGEMPAECSVNIDPPPGPVIVMGDKTALPDAISLLVRAGTLILPGATKATFSITTEPVEGELADLLEIPAT